jgi:ribosomal protein S1
MESDVVSGVKSSSQLERKMHLKARVLKTSKAGAIVDIGVEKPALLHVSQIVSSKNEPILRVEDALQENQEVEVYVRNLQGDRIEVSMRKPLALEWREIEKDMVLKGKIVELEKFGVLVDIGAERPGLVHISEITQGYVKNASDVVTIGDEVEVKVIDFNRRRKQVKLSMKALQPGLDEIEGVKITPAHPTRKKSKDKKKSDATEEIQETAAPEPTFMEIRLKEAMEKAGLSEKQNTARIKKEKKSPSVQEELLSRTLKSRN